jgi:hypothetical protein
MRRDDLKHSKFALLAAMTFAAPFALPTIAHAEEKAAPPAKAAAKPAPAVTQQPALAPANGRNLTGVWEIYPDPFGGEENTFVELEAPNGGPKLKEPYATEWKNRIDKRNAALKAGTPLADRSTLCLPEGMPGIMGAIFPIQFVHTPNEVIVLGEFLSQVRRIHLGKTMPPVEDVTPSFYGYSIGKWEGDTLVVTTLGVREDTEYFEIPHSNEMKITERIRITQPGYMEDQITIEDPKRLAEPYRFTYGYKLNPDYEITEYLCEKEDPLLKMNADGTMQMKVGGEVGVQDSGKAGDSAAEKTSDKKSK